MTNFLLIFIAIHVVRILHNTNRNNSSETPSPREIKAFKEEREREIQRLNTLAKLKDEKEKADLLELYNKQRAEINDFDELSKGSSFGWKDLCFTLAVAGVAAWGCLHFLQ